MYVDSKIGKPQQAAYPSIQKAGYEGITSASTWQLLENASGKSMKARTLISLWNNFGQMLTGLKSGHGKTVFLCFCRVVSFSDTLLLKLTHTLFVSFLTPCPRLGRRKLKPQIQGNFSILKNKTLDFICFVFVDLLLRWMTGPRRAMRASGFQLRCSVGALPVHWI